MENITDQNNIKPSKDTTPGPMFTKYSQVPAPAPMFTKVSEVPTSAPMFTLQISQKCSNDNSNQPQRVQ